MTNPIKARIAALTIAIVSAVLALTSSGTVEATSFAVGSPTMLFDSPQSSVVVPDPYAPGAAADIQTQFNINEPHANFSQVFTFGPLASQPTKGSGSTLDLGAVLGRLTSSTRLGVLNSPCNQAIAVTFIFVNGSTNTADVINPLAPSDPNPLAPMAADTNANGLADGVDKYPSFLNKMFDPDETLNPFDGAQPIQPWARYIGITNVVGLDVTLQLLVFKPGDLTGFKNMANHPFTQFVSAYGWPTTVVLNDPTVEPAPSAITDFCTLLTTTTELFGTSVDNACTRAPTDPPAPAGCPNTPPTIPAAATTPNEGGDIRSTNPPANKGILGTNTHFYGTYATSLRDADNDGKENQLDTCATTPDNMDPRISGVGDADNDGIADACDPDPPNPGNADQDNDGWQNRQDNCPLIPNDPNVDSELTSPWPADGGPRADGIGDPCDTGGNGPNLADGHYHVVYNLAPVCIEPSPNGGAFYCPETLTALGAASGTPENLAIHSPFPRHDGSGKGTAIAPATGSPAQACNDGLNNDNDASQDGADSGCGNLDSDGDGFSNSAELNVGTDPRYACPLSGHSPGDVGFAGTHDARPQELFASSARVTDFQDMNAMVPFLFQAAVFPTSNRNDLFPSAAIDFQDLNALVPYLFTSCTP